jgi:hypothetical protein
MLLYIIKTPLLWKIRMINEWWIRKNVEGSGHSLFPSTVLAIAWTDWGKTGKLSLDCLCLGPSFEQRTFRIQVRSITIWLSQLGHIFQFHNFILLYDYIVTWRLKAGIMESERTSIADQHFGKHILEVTQSTVEPPLLSSRLLRFVAKDKANNNKMSESLEMIIYIRHAWKLVQSRRLQSRDIIQRFFIPHSSDRVVMHSEGVKCVSCYIWL